MQPIESSAVARFARGLVEMPNGCVEWTGSKYVDGYGRIGISGVRHRTHRLAWELANGPIPVGMLVLHGCDNPPCCNVEHLSLGTNADNMRDRDAKNRHGSSKRTHCPQGHEYTPENTYEPARGGRNCLTCKRDRKRAAMGAGRRRE